MHNFNVYSRRSFLDRSFKTSLAVALSTLTDIPFVMKRALAEGNIGVPGPDGKIKKVLFIWMRFGNDGLNSIIPVEDSTYASIRPTIGVSKDPAAVSTYYSDPGSCFDPTYYADVGGTLRGSGDDTFSYTRAIKLGNRFAALHP